MLMRGLSFRGITDVFALIIDVRDNDTCDIGKTDFITSAGNWTVGACGASLWGGGGEKLSWSVVGPSFPSSAGDKKA
jgi:hypothetical protein